MGWRLDRPQSLFLFRTSGKVNLTAKQDWQVEKILYLDLLPFCSAARFMVLFMKTLVNDTTRHSYGWMESLMI